MREQRMISYPLRAAGTMTRVFEAGSEGIPMVFVHGMGARADRWRNNLDAMAAAGYHCYALDLPGHGFAEKGDRFEFSIPELSRFLAAAVDQLGVGKAILVGTSLGGHIAAHLACSTPERVLALVLVGSLGLIPLSAESRQRMGTTLCDATRAGVRGKLERLLYDQDLISEAWIDEECKINGSPGAAEAFARLAAYVAAEDGLNADNCGERLAAMNNRIPVMLLWGEDEKSVPLAVGQQAHAALPGSEFVVIPNARHVPYFEKPAEFNAALLAFCRKHAAAS
jgi:pimeloyl-ACP methyl ester carboxylesterase